MLLLASRSGPAVHSLNTICFNLRVRCSSTAAARQHEPLRILFCGADRFSIYSLRALCKLQELNPRKIESIDVVCRPDKRVGRKLKQIQQDTFTGWSPPSINLVIAVSFGLLVPARILKDAPYGGLNIHPSMLPDLRGPAPIIHTLLKSRTHTGVTLQTMHPSRFDHGTIIAQTPAPGIRVPPNSTPDQLLDELGVLGAELLVQGIEKGIFVPPVRDMQDNLLEPHTLEPAPKITPEDRHIDWETWTAKEIILHDAVLGRLWDTVTWSACFPDRTAADSKRVTFHGPWREVSVGVEAQETTGKPGSPFLVSTGTGNEFDIGLRTTDQRIVIPTAATIESESKGTGIRTLARGLDSTLASKRRKS